MSDTLPDREQTIKFLNDLKEFTQDTPFKTLTENYVEQLKATLNYGIGHTVTDLDWIGNLPTRPVLPDITPPDKSVTLPDIDLSSLDFSLTIKTVDNDYTTSSEDFNNKTMIRANANTNQVITLTKPSDTYVGKSLIIRKTNGDIGTFVTIKADTGVSISPEDSTPLRRVGSTVSMVYIGNGLWDMFGELP